LVVRVVEVVRVIKEVAVVIRVEKVVKRLCYFTTRYP